MRRLRKLRPRRAGAVQCLSPDGRPAPSGDGADDPAAHTTTTKKKKNNPLFSPPPRPPGSSSQARPGGSFANSLLPPPFLAAGADPDGAGHPHFLCSTLIVFLLPGVPAAMP